MLNQVLPHSDLVVYECPVSCDNCSVVYINKQISHKIICQCQKCGLKNNPKALERLGTTANAIGVTKSSKEINPQ